MLDGTKVVKDLQGMRDEGHLSDALARFAVRAIASSNDRFDWVSVYLVGENDELWLHNYIGEPTEHAKIPGGTGVAGHAVAGRKNANVADVTAVEGFLGSPDIQAELVTLIRAGDEVFGVIDVQSEQKGSFGDEDQIAIISIADKLAEQFAAERR